jgi:hypothetical protein
MLPNRVTKLNKKLHTIPAIFGRRAGHAVLIVNIGTARTN